MPLMSRYCPSLVLSACLGLGMPAIANAKIVRIEIEHRDPAFGGASFGEVGPYEQLRGHAYGELDPADPRNQVIVDLALAPGTREVSSSIGQSFRFSALPTLPEGMGACSSN